MTLTKIFCILKPDWKNVYASYEWDYETWILTNSKKIQKKFSYMIVYQLLNIKTVAKILYSIYKLRKDGKDLFKPEWKKPTEELQEVFLMNVSDNFRIVKTRLKTICPSFSGRILYQDTYDHQWYEFALLAEYDICPTYEDFMEVYK